MDAGSTAVPPTGEEESGKRRPPPPGPSRRRLYREPEEKKLAGICGGLADYTGVDPALVRAGAVLLAVTTPLTVIAYLVAIFAIDERPPSVPRVVAPPVEALERHRWVPLAVIVGALVLSDDAPWWWWSSVDVPLAAPLLIGVGVWLLLRSRAGSAASTAEAAGDGPGGADGPGSPDAGGPGAGGPEDAGGPEGPSGPGGSGGPESSDAAGGAFASATDSAHSVAERRSQNPWSPSQKVSNLSLGVDITTRNEESGRTADRTTDLRDAADPEAEDGALAPIPGSPPADEGAGPPGEFPPLTPPEWSGPEPSPSSAAPSPGAPGAGASPSEAGGPSSVGVAAAGGSAAGASAAGRPPSVTPPSATDILAAAVPPPARDTERLGLAVTALVLIGGGVVWFLHAADIAEPDPRRAIGAGLLVIGLGLVIAAWRGRARAALIPLGFVAVAVVIAAEAIKVPLDAGVAQRTVAPTRRSQVAEPVELLAGELRLDLRDLPLDGRRPIEIEAGVGFGELEVIVPRDAEVAVDLRVQAGEATGLGPEGERRISGVPVDEEFVIDGPGRGPRLELDLEVGLGKIEVVHA
ncbi:MAG TPA: PspC domain-containing protein [Acidimicrobiales bacterium]